MHHFSRGVAERSVRLDEAVLFVLLAAIAFGFALALRRSRTVDVAWAVVLVVLSAAWLALDGPLEGRTIWTVTATHGLTTGDLQVVPALVEAVGLAGRFRRNRRRATRRY